MAGNRPARERFEFSLDARQVAAVILGSLAALGLAFFLGHLLGQRVAERPVPVAAAPAPAAPAPGDPLAGLDPPPRPDGGDAKHKDTFHDRLTSPQPPADNLPAAPKPQPVPVAQAPAVKAPASPVQAAPAAPVPAPAGSTPAGSTQAAAPAATPGPGQAGAQPPAPAAAAGTTGPKVATDAAPPPAPGLAAAAPTVPAKVAPPPAKPGVATTAARSPAGKGGWVIQVHATQDRFDADRVAARLASRGARVATADVPGKGRWYRVRIGSYDSREAAERALRDLEKSGAAKGFVTPAG